MRDRTSIEHGFITSSVFDELVRINDPGAVNACMVHRQVHIDGSAGLIKLRHAERDPDSVLIEAAQCSGFKHTRLHALLQFRDLAPGAGELEALTECLVLHSEVTGVCDHEGQQVATHTVFRSTDKTAKLLAKLDDSLVRSAGPSLITLK